MTENSESIFNISDVRIDDEGKRLSMSSMGLKEIPENKSLKKFDLSIVETLDLSDNDIEQLSNLEYFSSLKTLILDNNKITSLTFLPKIPSLETLWLNNNRITDLDSLLDTLENYSNLEYLSLLGNPCCPFKDQTDYQHYRLWVLYRLKNLKFLDMSQVTEEDRKKAASQGQFSRVVKVKPVTPSTKNTKQIHYTEDEEVSIRRKAESKSYIGYTKHVYKGISSEGNRFICNPDL